MPVLLDATVVFSKLLLSLCIIMSSGRSAGATSYATGSKTFHQGHHGKHNRGSYLHGNTKNLTELAAFASVGTGVVIMSIFNRGFSEMAAVRTQHMHACLLQLACLHWPCISKNSADARLACMHR